MPTVQKYRIAEDFQRRKLSQIGEKNIFHRENFHRLLAFAAQKDDATPPNFTEKTFMNSHKAVKFEVFSLKSFPLYGTRWPISNITSQQLHCATKNTYMYMKDSEPYWSNSKSSTGNCMIYTEMQ